MPGLVKIIPRFLVTVLLSHVSEVIWIHTVIVPVVLNITASAIRDHKNKHMEVKDYMNFFVTFVTNK